METTATTFVVQYLSIKGNVSSYTCPPGEEYDPVWADMEGMTFTNATRALAARDGLLVRNPDFPSAEFRVVSRTVTESIVRGYLG